MNRVIYGNNSNTDMRYAVRSYISDPTFLMEKAGKRYLFLDHRELGVFKQVKKSDLKLILLDPIIEKVKTSQEPTSLANRIAWHLFQEYKLTREPVEVPISFPLDMADFLRAKGITLKPLSPFFPEREIKDRDEVDAIVSALRRTKKAFQRIEEILRASTIRGKKIIYNNRPLTSEFVKMEVDTLFLQHNLLNVEGIVISSGNQAAIPHHMGEGPLLAHQTIICDLFPRDRTTGYFADMTRTYVKGEPSLAVQRMYETVLDVQETVLKKIKPGILTKDIHQHAVTMFLNKGFDVGEQGFVHSTGHSIGLDIHEGPQFNSTSDSILNIGNILTVEPGLYYHNRGGVRIEDVICVMKTGYKNLTRYHKEYIIP